MKWILPAILLCLTCCHEELRPVREPAGVIAAPGNPAPVVSNHDGDSLTVILNGQRVRVRIEGIDAPENGQRHGDDSKSALASILDYRRVTIAETGTDRYGRTLARVYADGGDVGRAMDRLGWAMHFTRDTKDVDLAAAEIDARRERVRIWSAPDAPLPPWEWRKTAKVTEE